MIVALIDTTNKSQFIFPIPPRQISFSRAGETIGIKSIVLGEIPWGRGRKAEVVTLEGIWPGYKQTMPRNHYADSYQIDKEIKDILDHRPFAKEMRLVIRSDDFPIDINMPVYLESYDVEHIGGDDTLTYSMTLREYRAYRLRRFDVKQNKITSAKEAKRPSAPKPKEYTVIKGDTLSGITRKYLGSSARWRELYEINKGNMRSNSPHLIYPGEKLKIPEGWTS